jgi:hypothetical protein
MSLLVPDSPMAWTRSSTLRVDMLPISSIHFAIQFRIIATIAAFIAKRRARNEENSNPAGAWRVSCKADRPTT